jgi:molybdopterin converting factor small subunit
MYPVLSRILLIAALTSLFRIDAANAQAIPKSIQQGGTVGIAGGLIDGTYMRFADELAKVLDDGDNLRILPMVSYGAASNLAGC